MKFVGKNYKRKSTQKRSGLFKKLELSYRIKKLMEKKDLCAIFFPNINKFVSRFLIE